MSITSHLSDQRSYAHHSFSFKFFTMNVRNKIASSSNRYFFLPSLFVKNFSFISITLIFIASKVLATPPAFIYNGNGFGADTKTLPDWITQANQYYQKYNQLCLDELQDHPELPNHCELHQVTGTYNYPNATIINGISDPQGVIYETQRNGQATESINGSVRVRPVCPEGSMPDMQVIPGVNNFKMDCIGKVAVLIPNDTPQPFRCESSPTVGNPIAVSSGAKYQQENDLLNNNLAFTRTYNNTNGAAGDVWFHSFSNHLEFIRETSQGPKAKSATYRTTREACENGWSDIQQKINESWALELVAKLETDNTCALKKNNQQVRVLPIIDFDTHLFITHPAIINITRANGSTVAFTHVGNATWRPLFNQPLQLSKSANDPARWQFTDEDGTIEEYNHLGNLTSIKKFGNYIQTLQYKASNGTLEKITDNLGNFLNVEYDTALRSITDNNNRKTAYHYNANGLIDQVIYPDNSTRQYHYEDPRFPKNLTGITHASGLRFATWKYDDQGRAISSEHAGGTEKTLLAFNADGSTTVTNALNKKTIYNFASVLGIRRVTSVTGEATASCAGANQNYTYTPSGFLETKTDWHGNITKFERDNTGREISRIDAYGTPEASTTQTCWHPSLNLPEKIIDSASLTQYDYWPDGQLKKKVTKPRPTSTVSCQL